jgi:ATP-binding protein involved in chromosome partitioning
VELLGSLPLDVSIRVQTDKGVPSVVDQPDSAITAIYREIADKVAAKLGEAGKRTMPEIVISND